ncbi:hypothetical protein A3K73_03795 [Candidatus Pacearchaeota archaeon RBG_13_36_9]|nr:MAG: hypothetical protein A3K73_03795 [Candidatus Pacearchaeota archaeon RBG_13_36_9]
MHETFFKSQADKLGEKLGVKLGEKVTENQARILELIKQNQFITVIELAGLINISRKSVLENISKLKQKGLLKRIGPDKGGHWDVLE